MSKVLLAASAAALAIASPVFADKGGKGDGGNGGNGGGQPMKADRGQGGGQSMKADRGHGGGQTKRGSLKADRENGGELEVMRQDDNGGREMKTHGKGGGNDMRRAEMGGGREMKVHRNDRKDIAREVRQNNPVRVANQDFARNDGIRNDNIGDRGRFVSRNFNDGFRGFANGCPPGLDRKDNGCLPPGQASRFLGARLQSNYADSMLPFQYRSWYRDDGDHFFRSGDGFIYRVNRSNDLVDGIIPLQGGGGYYTLGDQWPDSYNFYNVPYQYRDYYADTNQYDYRYGDGAIYRLNSGTGVVDSIVALLAGDLGVGQRLPLGYDAYNVPMQYRDRYYDTADNMYRYNDGYIYQVDAKTRLISAVIDAII